MSNHELYEKVLASLNEDEGAFNAAARNWIEGADNAPFEDDEAKELFSKAKLACATWRNKAINGRSSKVRMLNYVRKIAEKNLPNPYPVEIYQPEEIEVTDDQEVTQEINEKKKKEPVHILGVVPDVGQIAEKPAEEEPKEEKRFFGKRKNR